MKNIENIKSDKVKQAPQTHKIIATSLNVSLVGVVRVVMPGWRIRDISMTYYRTFRIRQNFINKAGAIWLEAIEADRIVFEHIGDVRLLRSCSSEWRVVGDEWLVMSGWW